jgi:hypothetical protein
MWPPTPISGAVRAVHHDRGVPADVRPGSALDVLVAGEPRLVLGGIVLM